MSVLENREKKVSTFSFQNKWRVICFDYVLVVSMNRKMKRQNN